MIVRRDTRTKQPVALEVLAATVTSLLDEMQTALLQAATAMRDAHTVEVDIFAELAERVAANAGWSLAHWCGDAACEARVKAGTKATIRCIPRDLPPERGVVEQLLQRALDRVTIGGRHHETVDAIPHNLVRTSVGDDHRQSTGHGLERNHPHALEQ